MRFPMMGLALCLAGSRAWAERPVKVSPPSALDRYLSEARSRPTKSSAASPGSLYDASRPTEWTRELRASQIDDIVTIVVADRGTAVSRGTTTSQRTSSASGGIPRVAGRAIAPLGDLATLRGEQKLDGQGGTTRESNISTTLTGRIAEVLPNGNLLVEATKAITVNQESHQVQIRGIIRPFDISTANTVRSDRLTNVEIRINGKGVVADSIRRPNWLYRILLGILPF
jgi:flagellar L-ring protein precursor FlgH